MASLSLCQQCTLVWGRVWEPASRVQDAGKCTPGAATRNQVWEAHTCPVLIDTMGLLQQADAVGEALGGSVVHWEGHDALGPGAGQC